MARSQKVFKATMLVTVVVILSKLSGFIRDMTLAAYFGTGIENDAYVSAYSLFYLPVLLFTSCISATLIPLYVQEREQQGLDRSNHFASNTINLFALAALVISALFYALARPLVRIIYVGFDAEKAALTVKLVRIMLLSLVFNITSVSVASLLNATEKYVAAQLTGFPLNFSVIAAAVFFSRRYGIAAVGWGVFAANILQLLILVPFLRGWFTYTPVIDFGDKRFHRLVQLAGPALLAMGISELNHMIDHALASGLNPGDISAMSYAYRLVQFVQGVLLLPLTTIMFSKLSKLAASRDTDGMLDVLRRSVLVIALVILPIVAIAVVLSTDVIKFAYMRGAFGMDSVRVTAGVLVFYIIGVLAFGLRDFMNRMSHAMQDTRTPFRVSCLVVATNIVLNLILRIFMGANGLALATSIAGYTGTVVLLFRLRKRFGLLGLRAMLPDFLKIAVSTLAAAGVCLAMHRALPEVFGTGRVCLRLAACSGVSLAVYFVCCLALRVGTLRTFAADVLRRGRGVK